MYSVLKSAELIDVITVSEISVGCPFLLPQLRENRVKPMIEERNYSQFSVCY